MCIFALTNRKCDMFSFFNKNKEHINFWFSTDLHCHIVPGVDDGSPDVKTSLALIEGLHKFGINRIIATPHVTQATFENTPQTLAEPWQALTDAVRDAGIDVSLAHTAEYRIDEFFEEQMNAGVVMPYPDNHILIENSFIQEPWNLDRLIFDLQVKGYKPILAHPERYLYYHKRVERYRELKGLGVEFQVNILSLAGYYGKAEKHVAEWLAENEMVDFLGTDTHGQRHIEAFDEYLSSRDARRHLKLLAPTIKNQIFDL